jgi:hypothetical protein
MFNCLNVFCEHVLILGLLKHICFWKQASDLNWNYIVICIFDWSNFLIYCKRTEWPKLPPPSLTPCANTFVSFIEDIEWKTWTNFVIKNLSQKIWNFVYWHVLVSVTYAVFVFPSVVVLLETTYLWNPFATTISIINGSCVPVICIYPLLYISVWNTVQEKSHTLCDTCDLTDWMTRCCWASNFCFFAERFDCTGRLFKVQGYAPESK